MRTRSGRTFVTLLMFIPLVSIPLMAVFGIPEFSLVNRDDPLGFSADDNTLTNSSLGQATQLTNGIPDDPPASRFADRDSASLGNRQGNNPFDIQEENPIHQGLNGWAVDQSQQATGASANLKHTDFQSRNNNPQSLDDLDSTIERRTKMGNGNRATQTTAVSRSEKWNRERNTNATDNHQTRWKSAFGKLRNLGIENYTLKPGSSPKLFHFSCKYPSKLNGKPRITHRFESESEDPLQAIADVIEQIEKWLQQKS